MEDESGPDRNQFKMKCEAWSLERGAGRLRDSRRSETGDGSLWRPTDEKTKRLRAGAETALGEAEGKRRDEESNEGKRWERGKGEERLKDDEPEVIGQTCQTGKPSYRMTC